MWIAWIVALLAGAIAGWFPHAVGAAPLLAVLIWGTGVLRPRAVLFAALGAVLVRDAIVGLGMFTLVRLAAVAGALALLWAARLRPTWPSRAIGAALSAPAYYVILSIGDWLTQMCAQQPRTLAGFTEALSTAWPYLQRSWFVDMAITIAFVGVYTLGAIAVGAQSRLVDSR